MKCRIVIRRVNEGTTVGSRHEKVCCSGHGTKGVVRGTRRTPGRLWNGEGAVSGNTLLFSGNKAAMLKGMMIAAGLH